MEWWIVGAVGAVALAVLYVVALCQAAGHD